MNKQGEISIEEYVEKKKKHTQRKKIKNDTKLIKRNEKRKMIERM